MIPVLIGAAALAAGAAGAYALSGNDNKKSGEWVETIETRTITESEIPPVIRKKIRRNRKDADITEEMELELFGDNASINFCPYCGTKVRTAGAKFCTSCGKSLVD